MDKLFLQNRSATVHVLFPEGFGVDWSVLWCQVARFEINTKFGIPNYFRENFRENFRDFLDFREKSTKYEAYIYLSSIEKSACEIARKLFIFCFYNVYEVFEVWLDAQSPVYTPDTICLENWCIISPPCHTSKIRVLSHLGNETKFHSSRASARFSFRHTGYLQNDTFSVCCLFVCLCVCLFANTKMTVRESKKQLDERLWTAAKNTGI